MTRQAIWSLQATDPLDMEAVAELARRIIGGGSCCVRLDDDGGDGAAAVGSANVEPAEKVMLSK